MANIAVVADFGITFPNAEVTLALIVRWIHFLAGITWIGLLYFFNLVNAPFLKQLEPDTRGKVFPPLMSRAMAWFRWSALLTVAAGLFYWVYFIIMPDSLNARLHHIPATGKPTLLWFLLLWTVAFLIEMAVLMLPVDGLKSGPVLGIIVGIVVIAAAYGWVALDSHAWESSRLQSIGIGGGIGWFMMLNVWGVVWRIHKKLIRWTKESAKNGTPLPAEAAKLAKQALVVARINFVLSFPMLLFMAAASHYPFIVE